MKVLKLLLYICLFFIVGEGLIRIDMKYDLLDNAPKTIEIKIEESNLKEEIDSGSFVLDSSQIRILVLGDSYIYGGGIDPANKFSKKLSMLLNEANLPEKNILVLDVSRPSNNTIDNYNTFLFYQDIFKPQFVFWAYNFNDILGPMELGKKESQKFIEIKTPPKRMSKKRTGMKNIVNKLYSYSELTRYLSGKFQNELKAMGIVAPAGDFHYLTKIAYLESNKNWQYTQKVFNEVSQICQLNQSQFILYQLPEFHLLHKPNLFSAVDNAMLNYSKSDKNVTYINGADDFRNVDGDQLMVSRYDGHPNEKAHLRIAEKMADLIKAQIIGARKSQ